MSVKDAVAERIKAICKERNIRTNELANISGITASTVYSLLDSRRRDVSMITVKKLCDGLEISLAEFFSGPEFDALEQEIQKIPPLGGLFQCLPPREGLKNATQKGGIFM